MDQYPDKPDKGPNKGPNNQPQMPGRFSRSLLSWVVILGLAVLLFVFLSSRLDDRVEISADEFWQHARNGNLVDKLVISESQIEGTLAKSLETEEPQKFYVTYNLNADQNFTSRLEEALAQGSKKSGGAPVKYTFDEPNWWEGVLPHLLLMVGAFLILWFFLFRRIGAAGGGGGFLGNFGRSRHRVLNKEQSRVTFNDVAGIDEAKDEVEEIITFLKNPRKFQRLGGRVPRGVLLVGEPGCGKTLLAKAIAGEAEVPFFSISGSDFVEMFVGVGASRVRDLFKQAKENSPCIIFLDEIDAVGRKRGSGFNGGGHDEREQTLNAILVEMDGFDSSDQVIVCAATNRVDVLDPALTRPGRFDRQIDVPLPDLKGRVEILKIYAAKVKCGPDVDLHRMARGTPMFSGADLAALVNEAAIAATMENKEYVEMIDLEEARDKVRWGRARKSRVIDEKEKEVTAYHEAGHALVQVMTPHSDPLHKVSIIPRGAMGGATFSLPEKDRYLYSRNYLLDQMRVCFGGRLAEEIFCGDVTSGAQNDIMQATEIARRMVMDWGMSEELGLINYKSDDRSSGQIDLSGKPFSDQTAEKIDREVRKIVDKARKDTHEIIESNRDRLERLARALLKYETLSSDEVQRIFDGEDLDKPTVGDILQREQERSESGKAISPPVTPNEYPDTDSPPLPAR
ncbi:MAG: ATP-dependent zinc metalloprotease FtsH [Phycisphaerae bacterium]